MKMSKSSMRTNCTKNSGSSTEAEEERKGAGRARLLDLKWLQVSSSIYTSLICAYIEVSY